MKVSDQELDAIKAGMKNTWMAGDFGRIALAIQPLADDFVGRRRVQPGTRVLDVACGSGNVAIPAARAGAVVTGIDIAPNLVAQARERAAAEGLDIAFEEGDAEALSSPDASFDVVMTMFGAMFAPRPDRVAAELVRVCRPGGVIAMANWTAQGFPGQMFKVTAAYAPLPPGVPPPVLWGDETTVRQRFSEGVADLRLTRVTGRIRYPFPPSEVVEHFRRYFGPTQRAFETVAPTEQEALRADLERVWSTHNMATDGTTEVEAEYLDVEAVRA